MDLSIVGVLLILVGGFCLLSVPVGIVAIVMVIRRNREERSAESQFEAPPDPPDSEH